MSDVTSLPSRNARVSRRRAPVDIFRPLTLRKAADEVISVIVDAIHGGLIEPGDRLPREVDLAARLDVSRNTINAALARLEEAGVVSIRRGRAGGAFIESRSIPPSLLLDSERNDPPEIVQILQVRRPLETQATLLAAEHASGQDLADLRRLVELLPEYVSDPHEFIAVDFRFHVALGRFSANPILAQYMDDLFRRFTVLRAQYPVGAIDLVQAIKNQAVSLETLASRDSAAIQDAIDEHLGSVEEHFLGMRLPRWMPDVRRPGGEEFDAR